MRHLFAPVFRFALMSGALLCVTPTFAQAPPPPAPVTPPAPITAPVLAPEEMALIIPAPPGGKLRVEMDARSEDLLGMMKSFLQGIGDTGALKTAGQTGASANPLAEIFGGSNLADMLKDVNHVHFAVYELPQPPAPPIIPSMTPPLGKPKPGATGAAPPVAMPDSPLPAGFDSNAFYEAAFSQEGAHRVLYADADAYKLVMVGFPDRHGFAFAASGAGYVAVSRSDGYPDMQVLSAFISRVTSAVMKSKTGKGMINSTLGGLEPGKSGPTPDPSSPAPGKSSIE